MDGDLRRLSDCARNQRALETDEIDVNSSGGERLRVVLHTGAASEISKGDDGGSHVGLIARGAGAFYLRSPSSQNRASKLAATRRRYSAVERKSSMGAISSRSVSCAAASDSPRASAASVRGSRIT